MSSRVEGRRANRIGVRGRILFNFQLGSVTDVAPWGEGRDRLHWFGLSDGWYWLDVAGAQLFRYSDELVVSEEPWCSEPSSPPYVDYYVARLWEDVLDMLPAILEPVPEVLGRRIADGGRWSGWLERAGRWMERSEDEACRDTYEQAVGWWDARAMDTGYLRHGPDIWICTVGANVYIRWDNREAILGGKPVWAAVEGEETMSVDDFLQEVRSFDAQFMRTMAERVSTVPNYWGRPDMVFDVGALEREQLDRSRWLTVSLDRAGQPPGTDWDAVLAAIDRIDDALGQEEPYQP